MYGCCSSGKDVTFETELNQIANQTIENDIPQYTNMNVLMGRKLKQLLAITSENAPFKPVMQKPAGIVGIDHNYLSNYSLYVEKAGMMAQVRDATGGIRGLGKVERIYLDNINLIYILGGENSDIDNIRGAFFYNQMRMEQDIMSPRVSDFQVGERTFEIDGRSKGQQQVAKT